MNNLLIGRTSYNQFMSIAIQKGRTAVFRPTFMVHMNHVGILEDNGMITMLKDRTAAKKFCTREEWNKRTAL